MQKEIKQTWYFNQPPQIVWDYLTKPELIAQWLMESDFKPVVGHKFTFTCSKTTLCEVLEVIPNKLLSYTWRVPGNNGEPTLYSKVVWTLHPKKDGTELLLLHNGFELAEHLQGHTEGWNACRPKLEELLKPAFA